MSEGGMPTNLRSLSLSRLQQKVNCMPFVKQLCRRFQSLPQCLLRFRSLPSPGSSIQPSPQYISAAQSPLLNPSLSSLLSIRTDGGGTEENWDEVQLQSNAPSPISISNQTTFLHSHDDGEGNHEGFRRGSSNHKVLECIFAIANFVIELASIVFDQLSSLHNSLFLPMCMGMSFLALIICLFELVYNVRKQRAARQWRLFNPPSESGLSSGRYIEIVGVVCAFGQCVVATTNYFLFLRTGKNTIKISIWAVIFAFCQLCSKFFKEFSQDVRKKDASMELISSA